MSGTTIGIWIIVVVIVLALAVWLTTVALAARRPGQEHPQHDQTQTRGLVQGGQHVGGGRSVGPTRDAPVPEGGGNPPPIEEQDPANAGRRSPGSGSGSPMDL